MTKRWFRRVRRLVAPKSLRLQLLSRSLLILSGLLILIGVFQYIIMSHFLYQNTAANIRNEIRSTPPHAWDQILGLQRTSDSGAVGTSSSQNSGGNNGFANSANQTGDGPVHDRQGNPGVGPDNNPFFSFNLASVAVIDNTGAFTTLHGTAPELSQKQYQTALQSTADNSSYQIVRDSTGKSQLVVLQTVADPGSRTRRLIQVGTFVSSLQHVLVQQLLIFGLLALLALIGGLFTFLPILRRTLIPLSSMVETVSRINAGNLDERVETRHDSQLEVSLLASSFNEMLNRLEASFEAERESKEKMRQFVADASHELRTPLTSIHGFLEVLLRGAASKPDQLERALKSMFGESERIRKLVADLLLLAQLDKEPHFTLTDGNMSAVIEEMEPQLRLLAGHRSVTFSLDEQAETKFDKDRVKQVVLNLFHNAVHHTDEQTGEIRVDLRRDTERVVLSVSDNGPGIPPDKVDKIFERFYRVDTSRSRLHGGAGLGLAITESIVQTHGGTISCQSEVGHGSTFTVTLPVS